MDNKNDIHNIIIELQTKLILCIEEQKKVIILTKAAVESHFELLVEDIYEGISISDGINKFEIKESNIQDIQKSKGIDGEEYYLTLIDNTHCYILVPN